MLWRRCAARYSRTGWTSKGRKKRVRPLDHPAYGDLSDEDARHETAEHAKEEWVRGDVHTNTLEGAWALFKRGVAGSYHKVSRKHLERYLVEFEFRFNNRNNPFIFQDALRELVTADHLTFEELTEAARYQALPQLQSHVALE